MGQLAGHRMRILRIFSVAKMGQKKSGLSWLIVVADNV